LDQEVPRQERLIERVNGAGPAFLGLTVGCARCHDHNFDPFSAGDYYRLQAFFASASYDDVDLATKEARDARKKDGDPLSAAVEPKSRLELAKWMAAREHPLTARVIVNRLWQHHFGRGLVGTPNDFGLRGEKPTHPELLDWLAVELVETKWSLKHVHRLIVT